MICEDACNLGFIPYSETVMSLGDACTAAANGIAVFTVTGIYDLAFLIAAKRTFHGKIAPFPKYYT
jgi:hypothetical protein